LFGGWYTSAILTYHSGLPTEVYGDCQGTAGSVLFGAATLPEQRPVNIVPGVPQTTNQISIQQPRRSGIGRVHAGNQLRNVGHHLYFWRRTAIPVNCAILRDQK